MRIEDISVGDKVTYFDGGAQEATDAVVTAVLDVGPGRYSQMIYAKPIGGDLEKGLYLNDYKKAWPSRYLSWCFSDNERFKRHVIGRWAPKEPAKKGPDPRYASLDHGNNERMKGAAIAAQREFVNKVTEQGFYWQLVRDGRGGHEWVRRDEPEFVFDKSRGGYLVRTPCGLVRGRKFGRAVAAEKPTKEAE